MISDKIYCTITFCCLFTADETSSDSCSYDSDSRLRKKELHTTWFFSFSNFTWNETFLKILGVNYWNPFWFEQLSLAIIEVSLNINEKSKNSKIKGKIEVYSLPFVSKLNSRTWHLEHESHFSNPFTLIKRSLQ